MKPKLYKCLCAAMLSLVACAAKTAPLPSDSEKIQCLMERKGETVDLEVRTTHSITYDLTGTYKYYYGKWYVVAVPNDEFEFTGDETVLLNGEKLSVPNIDDKTLYDSLYKVCIPNKSKNKEVLFDAKENNNYDEYILYGTFPYEAVGSYNGFIKVDLCEVYSFYDTSKDVENFSCP